MKDALSAYSFIKSQNDDTPQRRRKKGNLNKVKRDKKEKKKQKKVNDKKKSLSPHPQKLKLEKLAQLQSGQDNHFNKATLSNLLSYPENNRENAKKKADTPNDDKADAPNDDKADVPNADKAMSDKLGNVEMYEAPGEMPYMMDSRLEGKKCFEYLIHPVSCDRFFGEIWEKRPLLLKRHKSNYYNGILKMSQIKELIKSHKMRYGKHIDVTSYTNGVRKTHNPPGIACSSVVWDYYRKGCSIRLLNPQQFTTTMWKLNATLQEFFGSFVGANVYLTPPGSQGFAPHYDDIEAFVLQLEGKKIWKLYKARNLSEVLPRYSSENFSQKEIGEPIMETELEPGDLLYFPRGVIHQAVTPPDNHSLHITLSTAQRNTWGDLLDKMIPRALELAFEEDIDFRRSLPKDYLDILGVAHSDLDSPRRRELTKTIHGLVSKLISYLPIDAAVDQMGKQFVHDCLPPVTGKNEKPNTLYGNDVEEPDGVVDKKVSFEPNTKLKLLRANILRLVIEDTDVKLYHSASNSREYHEEDPQFVDLSPVLAPGVEYLIHTYPNCVTVDSLPLETLQDKISIAKILYYNGLIMVYQDVE